MRDLNFNGLEVHSGWSSGVHVTVKTPRGQTVILTASEWEQFKAKIDQIIALCEQKSAAADSSRKAIAERHGE